MTNTKIPTRIIYVDFSRDIAHLPMSDINKIMTGIADKQSITLDGKDVLEIHLLSRFSYEKVQRIEVGNKESYNILYCEPNTISEGN